MAPNTLEAVRNPTSPDVTGDRTVIDEKVISNVWNFLETQQDHVASVAEMLPSSTVGIIYDLDGVILDKNGPRISILKQRNEFIRYLRAHRGENDIRKIAETYYRVHPPLVPSLFPLATDSKELEQWKAQSTPKLPDFRKLITSGNYVSIRAILNKYPGLKDNKDLLPFYDEISRCEKLYSMFSPMVSDVVDQIRKMNQNPHITTLGLITGTLEQHHASLMENPTMQEIEALHAPYFNLEMRNPNIVSEHTQIDSWKAAYAGLLMKSGKWHQIFVVDDTPLQSKLIDYLSRIQPDIFGNVKGLCFNQFKQADNTFSWENLNPYINEILEMDQSLYA